MNNISNNHISAIILAAGLSSRMKDFKPLLPFGGKTMIEMVISLFKNNNINDIVVVTGHNSSQIQPLIKKAGALPVFNQDFKSGMLSSIQEGVKNIQPDTVGFFLLPVDIPAIRPSTINLMIQKFKRSNTNIILPYFDDKPGHPPLIPSYLKDDILALKNGSILRDLLFSKNTKRAPLKVHDQGILMDADDKNQYNKVCQKLKTRHIPDKEECLSIINEILPEHDSIRTHMADVSFAALKIAHAITHEINTDLIIAAALLHDIKRKEKNHAVAGAQFINKMGFTEVSKIISQHMDIDFNPKMDIKEKEIVYFADKICNGHGNNNGIDLNYHQRFTNSVMKSPWAITSISKRYENTQLIQARIEKSAKKSIKEILSS
ncbi:MAG: NTP transferase domain-containing protein [Desulfobacteraceae bacterium]|nr:NTP transferase domain-containing protein [Desulfobacteraceae bacterium]